MSWCRDPYPDTTHRKSEKLDDLEVYNPRRTLLRMPVKCHRYFQECLWLIFINFSWFHLELEIFQAQSYKQNLHNIQRKRLDLFENTWIMKFKLSYHLQIIFKLSTIAIYLSIRCDTFIVNYRVYAENIMWIHGLCLRTYYWTTLNT